MSRQYRSVCFRLINPIEYEEPRLESLCKSARVLSRGRGCVPAAICVYASSSIGKGADLRWATANNDWGWAGQVRLPPDPGNASRFGPAISLASSGLAHTPTRMAQKIVNQTSGHEIRLLPRVTSTSPFSNSLPFLIHHPPPWLLSTSVSHIFYSVRHATHLISTGPGEPLVRESQPEPQVAFDYCW